MKIVVLKFGGTSVGSIERIKNVARIVISHIKKKWIPIILVNNIFTGQIYTKN